MNPLEVEQGSQEWHEIRAGKVTGSKIADLLAERKDGKPSAMRSTYMWELIADRWREGPVEVNDWQSGPMAHGKITEPVARAFYEFKMGLEVKEVGFVPHPLMPEDAGCSPDGLILDARGMVEGAVEIKCPNTATHAGYCLSDKMDSKYVKQAKWVMECTGASWIDLISFDPRVKLHCRMFRKRIRRDNEELLEMRKSVEAFIAEMKEKMQLMEQKDFG